MTMTTDETDTSSWRRWGALLPALTFLVGLGLGLLLMFAVGGDDGSVTEAEPTPTPSGATASAGDTVVTIPAACEAAAENITEATRLLDDVAASIRDFQPQELVERLNRLEDIDRATRPLADRCSEASVTQAPSESAEPTESP